ncbi:MAG TPA: glycerate kinase [Microbacterium sp.]|uniref:glycerate kinase n=1 Tax=Microbacterium sp. TaxID=51671 RepID=UPI002B4A2E02|nr:glycerate kinase [Microbacterium sp.]HKT56711.1 glycerate kinase [Microbacterium sp.]
MRILIASDKFKGSLTGSEVASALAEGIRNADAGIHVDAVPVADGGEGTVAAALAVGFTAVNATVTGPTSGSVTAQFAVKDDQAIIEMAAASGLDVLPGGILAPLTATSRGTGDLIRAALDHGCTTIILGVGGSACTDGGAGMLQALGARLTDVNGREVAPGGAALADLASVDLSDLDDRLTHAHVVLAGDVDNPLLGERGAPAVFAPQKGATPQDVALLDAALGHYAALLVTQPGVRDVVDAPGAGGAGGVGYAAMAVLGAERRPGVEVVQELTGLAARVASADLVITGEGSLDEQSLGGKAPIGVAQVAKDAGVPVIAICGRTLLTPEQLSEAGFARTYALTDIAPDVPTAIAEAGRFVTEIGARIAADVAAIAQGGHS